MGWRTPSFELLVLGFANTVAAQGQVWVVDDSGGADFTTIQAGIDAAGEGDILLVNAGTYSGIRHVQLRFVRGEGSMLVGLDEAF